MREFKIGDKVRIARGCSANECITCKSFIGHEGVITEILTNELGAHVRIEGAALRHRVEVLDHIEKQPVIPLPLPG
jgi:ribosomal protein L21E